MGHAELYQTYTVISLITYHGSLEIMINIISDNSFSRNATLNIGNQEAQAPADEGTRKRLSRSQPTSSSSYHDDTLRISLRVNKSSNFRR
jgi:hypothetical protein